MRGACVPARPTTNCINWIMIHGVCGVVKRPSPRSPPSAMGTIIHARLELCCGASVEVNMIFHRSYPRLSINYTHTDALLRRCARQNRDAKHCKPVLLLVLVLHAPAIYATTNETKTARMCFSYAVNVRSMRSVRSCVCMCVCVCVYTF